MTYTVPRINRKVRNIKKAVLKSEQYYSQKIETLAQALIDDKSTRIVLISGPSSSGKTTTAHLLRENLKSKGINTFVISLDNFYLPMDKLPKRANGEIDFESVHGLDIEDINNCLESLVKTGSARIPKYDFTVSDELRRQREEITLKDNDMAIIEGIHALNPLLHKNFSSEYLYKIYISLSSKIHGKNGETILSSKDLRLIRRIVRDNNHRHTSAANTLDMWQGVLAGEEKFLYCFKRTVDYKFDTFLSYEPLVFRNECIKLLEEITPESDNYGLAQKLIFGISQFKSVPEAVIPKNSLLNEFVANK